MKTLKRLAFGIALAIWAWLGAAGFAAAQYSDNIFGQSCDPNQGAACGPYGYAAVWCDPADNECLQFADLGYQLANGTNCATVTANKCGSGFCNNQPFGGGPAVCCAGPGDVDHGGALPAYVETACVSSVTIALAPVTGTPEPWFGIETCSTPIGWLMFDGGGPCIDWWSPRYVDAGTNPLATHGLMKADPGLLDGGSVDQIVIYKPLGYFDYTEGWLDGVHYGFGGPQYVKAGPDYFCQMPYYNSDGGWTLADVGAGRADLAECGQSTNPAKPGGKIYFPCCGNERDAGAGTNGEACTPDGHGVPHCACIQDGNECDVPRYLDRNSDAYFPSMGECCSPGLATQVYDLTHCGLDGGNPDSGCYDAVIAQGQGFCRPTSAGLTPPSGGFAAKGYCNCLPEGTACSGGDCCGILSCFAGTCQNLSCANYGTACSVGGDCCSGHCTGNHCGL